VQYVTTQHISSQMNGATSSSSGTRHCAVSVVVLYILSPTAHHDAPSCQQITTAHCAVAVPLEHLRTQHLKWNSVIQKHNTLYNVQPEPDRSLYRGLSVPTDLSSHTQTSARCSCLPLWVIIGFYVQFSETT